MENQTETFKRLLSGRKIYPTKQRLFIASYMLCRHQHLSAEQVFSNIGPMPNGRSLSKATVYNTLNLFSSKGLLQEVDFGDGRTYFDSNISDHHHFYNVDTGEIIDVPWENATFGAPPLPENTQLDSVSLCFNIKNAR